MSRDRIEELSEQHTQDMAYSTLQMRREMLGASEQRNSLRYNCDLGLGSAGDTASSLVFKAVPTSLVVGLSGCWSHHGVRGCKGQKCWSLRCSFWWG